MGMEPVEAQRLDELERKVSHLYEHLGIDEPGATPAPKPPEPQSAQSAAAPPVPDGTIHIDGRVLDAIQDGNIIEAIKLQRQATGQGLAEAKAAVEGIVETRKALGL